MKKELKRYTLCEYCGEQKRYFDDYQDYQKLVIMLDKLNKSNKNQFYFGNISCEFSGGLYEVSIHIYNRLTPKMTISEIDALTSDKTEEEVIKKFKNLTRTVKPFTPDINIMYFEEKNEGEKDKKNVVKRVKYTPVLYKRDAHFMDQQYIKNCIKYAASQHDINFFREMANEFCFHHIVSHEIEWIRRYVAGIEAGENYYKELKYMATCLYTKLIQERNADKTLCRNDKGETLISRRRLRDVGFFVRDYMIPLNEKHLPTKYNKQLTEKQLEKLREQEEKKLEKKKQEANKQLPQAVQLKLF